MTHWFVYKLRFSISFASVCQFSFQFRLIIQCLVSMGAKLK